MSSEKPKLIKSIGEAVNEETRYLKAIKSGEIVPVITPYNFMNLAMLNGWHPSDIITIGGLSGGGKTAFANQLAYGVCRLNTNIRVLYFCFELAARKMVSRLVSKAIKRTMREIYDVNSDLGIKEYTDLSSLPIDFIEKPIKPESIRTVLQRYCAAYPNDRIVAIIDHSLLVVPETGTEEGRMIKDLCAVLNEEKKKHNLVTIILSQLNNAMLDPKRMSNPTQQYPRKNDIFGSKYLVHISDNITVLMNPKELNLVGGKTYGIHKLPLMWDLRLPDNPNDIRVPLIYAHTIKARDGAVDITPLVNRLKYQQLSELPKQELIRFWDTVKGN
jgi:hypothetical protein